MCALSPADCLALWESGQGLHPLDRSLLAIQTAFPEMRNESVADWPLGRRNRALAELRCTLFGRWIRGWGACEACAEKMEFAVDGAAISDCATPDSEARVQVGERSFRLPSSRDLARITTEADPARAAVRLLELCSVLVTEPEAAQEQETPAQLSEGELELIGEAMSQADPLAEILLHFDCPVCGHSFDQALDLSSFLWSEIEGRAKKLLLDVYALASSFGWSENEILSLSAARRDFYLQMVRA
ncbi:MAG TPA: hypothetical protein VK670_10720 [Silvibacterium sp.]|nr:hypothetical protein [Silvibacterium sp.]